MQFLCLVFGLGFLVQFGHIPSWFVFGSVWTYPVQVWFFGLFQFWFGALPRRVFADPPPCGASLLCLAWFGRTGQLGLPSCLFGHSASFGGWVGCCRCLARLPFLLLCSLLVPLPCWVWGAWPLLRCVCFAACPRPLLLWLRVVLAGCPALFRHRLVWSSLVFWLCCGFPLLGVDLLFSQDLSV